MRIAFHVCSRRVGKGRTQFPSRSTWTKMHSSSTSSELGFLPTMLAFSGPTSLPEFDFGPPSTSSDLQTGTHSNSSWEKRCLRKHRRRVNDEGCSAKRRRLMEDAEVDVQESSVCPPPPVQVAGPALLEPCPAPVPQASPILPRPEMDASCMEVEAAQRRLQEIEDRITLEDDDEDGDLDVELTQRRPVLVMSQSLKEGLQRGLSDILPHTVAQSVNHSCMELVLWRPPDDTFAQRLRDSIQTQRKQQTAPRQPSTPRPSPVPRDPLSPTGSASETHSPLYSFPGAHSCAEEDMEM